MEKNNHELAESDGPSTDGCIAVILFLLLPMFISVITLYTWFSLGVI